jgi:serine/threonine protein kinase
MIQGKQGLLHRDVKPANIMLTHLDDDDDEQRILLADFGIARNLADVSGLTTTNMTVGTVAYSAPEQLMGEDVDGRADQSARVHAEQFGVERHLRALGLVPFAPSGDPLGQLPMRVGGPLKAARERIDVGASPRNSTRTVGDCLAHWRATKLAASDRKPSTRDLYANRLTWSDPV